MANCIYCNQVAGFLRRKHKECYAKFQEGVNMLNEELKIQVEKGFNQDSLSKLQNQLFDKYFIKKENIKEFTTHAWDNNVETILRDDEFFINKEHNLLKITEYFGLQEDDLNKKGSYTKLVERTILEGTELLNKEFNIQLKTGIKKNVIDTLIKSLQNKYFIKEKDIKDLVISAWENCVESALKDGIITEKEEDNLVKLQNHFNLEEDELNKNDAFKKVVQGAVLRDLAEGKMPDRIGDKEELKRKLPFNFTKKEELIWCFTDVDYYETKVKTRYEGGSTGASVRVAKGVYIRTSSFKGYPVSYEETNHIDTGILAVTDQCIYFSGDIKDFRVKLDKIVAFKAYSDGAGIQKDGATAKPQTFSTGDGWFIYNLLNNISNLE